VFLKAGRSFAAACLEKLGRTAVAVAIANMPRGN